jgi:thiamine biosynthesis lipoprotein
VIARARPLLGTLVSIRTDGGERALREAFEAIERVEALMSKRRATSDVSLIAREAHRRPLRVHPWTARVLACASTVSRASGGAFDVTLRRKGASYRDLVLIPGGRVRARRRVQIDLGGVAKGFAVDRAVEALRRAGARSGCVNAGGDLRVFGEGAQAVRVRLPSQPQQSAVLGLARERAFATSGAYFQDEGIDARDGNRLFAGASITISARTCIIADALTKAVGALGPDAALLARFGACAYLVDSAGTLHAAARR